MDVIEFLQGTDQRNLEYNVGFLVKEKLKERNIELVERRKILRDFLECENLNYDEELLFLVNQRIKASEQKRLDWIGHMRLERERAQEELLKLKSTQRELENCEKWRELESRQILLETKKAQLYQIKEKQALKCRETNMEQQWQEAMQRLATEKQRQDVYEQKLQKVIAGCIEGKNAQQGDQLKANQREESKCLRQAYAEDDARAVHLDRAYRGAALQGEWQKKQQQNLALRQQITENRCNVQARQALAMQEALQLKIGEDAQIIRELNEKIGKRIRNRDWHKSYLSHTQQQQQDFHSEQKALDAAYIGTGCVLQQQLKAPYGKMSR